MASMVSFLEPRVAAVVEDHIRSPGPGEVHLRTLYSGISAGTELTAYRGTNPYLAKRWDEDSRLFLDGATSLEYPVDAWGYEEVGIVQQVGEGVTSLAPGQLVWGAWGHRTDAIRPAEACAHRTLPHHVDPRLGIFGQIGGIALNFILDADIHVGETVVVFGLGVPGQIAAQLARLNGGRVIGVDSLPGRRELACRLGADSALDPAQASVAEQVRELTDGRGADVCIEVTGNHHATQEAIRTVAFNSRVVVGSFLQGQGQGLRLGEEFHHNRIQLVSSQLSGVPAGLSHRWDFERLCRTVLEEAISGRLRLVDLITHTMPLQRAAEAFRLLDERPGDALQVVLDVTGTAGSEASLPSGDGLPSRR